MQVAAVALTVSAIGAGLVHDVWSLVFWRLVGGIGIGVASVIAPAYIAEISPAHVRGRLDSLQQLAIVLGIFVALASDAYLAGHAGGAAERCGQELAAWRWMFLVAAVPAVLYGLLVLGVPESPRYLVAKGDNAGAADVLRRVLGLDGDALQKKIAKSTPACTPNAARASPICASPAAGCSRSSGSASCCRCSSSSSAST